MTSHWIWLVCVALVTVMTSIRSTRRDVQGRKFSCHCRDKPCNFSVDCRGNCDPGWYGSYCQKQNVALNATATQSGTYQKYNASRAVDGNTNTTFKSETCTHAAAGSSITNSWWNVALSKDHKIRYINIYNRKENAFRRNGSEVLVDGMSCFKWSESSLPPTIWNVTCDKTLTGRNVTIKTNKDSLSLCEVQVFVCSDFWFGVDCEKQCNCFNETEICDKMNGQCASGCSPGFNGTDCLRECVNGTYGFNCSSSCGHCLNNAFCDRTNGTCLQGCADGWIEPACKKACDGKYGKGCAWDCGHCNGTSCNNVDGSCPNGCEPGWNGTTCAVKLQVDDKDGTFLVGGTSLVVGFVSLLVIIFVVAVVVAVVLIWLKRRSDKPPNASNILEYVPGQLFNVEDEDEAFSVEVECDVPEDDDATYCNWISPYVVLEKLAQYIQRKQEDEAAFENEYKMLPYGIRGKVEEGKKPENKPLNRFAALYPYDDSRVILERSTSGYINASYIPGFPDGSKYIATQGPIPATVGDFWTMVWQQRVSKVAMVTQLKEMQRVKCEQYWPEKNKIKKCGDLTIGLETTMTRTDYTIRKLTVNNARESETRRVTHFQFLTWPDHGVPSAPALVSFWKRVKQLDRAEEGPLVIHCSAGVGRTGTFIALDYLMDQAEAEHRVNVFQCVSRMRQARMNMVQTVGQYVFVHIAVLEALESRGTFYTITEFRHIFGPEQNYNRQQDAILKKEFKSIQAQRPRQTEISISDAKLQENVPKNKNKNILPGNKTRPYLSTPVGGYNDYINAVTLPSVMRPCMVIATQTPMENTVVDFWRLVCDHDCFTVVCLDDSQDVQCLYPGTKGNLQAGPFNIRQSQKRNMGSFTEKTLVLSNNKQQGKTQTISILTLNSLRGSMSRDTDGLLQLVNRVDTTLLQDQHKVLVHCADGARMCGVFCSVLNTISRLKLDCEVDIYLTIRELQCARPQFIQSFAEYQYCYDMAKAYIRSENAHSHHDGTRVGEGM